MKTSTIKTASVAAILALGLAACGGDDGADDADTDAAPEENGDEATPEVTDDAEVAGGEPFGPACDAVPEDGDGSFEGMAQDPVATAASNNPELSTLVDAVTEADLVDTLNDAEDITVFAPANSAFEAVPEEDLNALLADQEELTEVLTYHVVEGEQSPEDLEDGEFTSLQGDTVTTSGTGEQFTVNDEAEVVCGNVQTSNATVYIIDSVLMPEA